MMLCEGKVGRSYKIIGIEGGHGVKGRLMHLGIVPNSIVRIKRAAPLHGPLMLSVNGIDLLIGRGIARKIVVEEV